MRTPRTVWLAQTPSTILWSGDALVIGGTLPGIAAARALAAAGKRVCIIEAGPTLAVEWSAFWRTEIPGGKCGDRLAELARAAGGLEAGRLDPFVAALVADELVSEVGVAAIVRVQPVRWYAGPSGETVRVEVAGKSGRQVAEAPLVVDATPGRMFSAPAGGATAPCSASTAIRRGLFEQVASEGTTFRLPSGAVAGVEAWTEPGRWPGQAFLNVRLSCEGIPDTAALLHPTHTALCRAAAWLRSSQPAFSNAILAAVAPDVDIQWDAPCGDSEVRSGIIALPLSGDLNRDVQAAEERVLLVESPSPAPPPPAPTIDAETVCSCELGSADDQDLEPATLPAAPLHVHEPCDVLVAGFGTGGAPAALAAASYEGVQVVALDPAPCPGGIGTAGNIHAYYLGVRTGLHTSIEEAFQGEGAALAAGLKGYHPVAKADVLFDRLEAAGVRVLNGHTVFGVVREGRAVRAVLSAASDGYHMFPCRTAVDATGDGDLAAAAGAEFILGREGDGFPQPYSYTPLRLDNGKLWHRNFDAGWVDPTDTLDYSRAHFEGRSRLRNQAPFSEDHRYIALAPLLGIRESRFIRGRVTLTFEDFLEGRTWTDVVMDAYAHYDNHAMDYAEESDWARRHVALFGLWRYHVRGHVPWRVLIPRDLANVLIGCRAVSVDHDLHQLFRMQRDVERVGEIVGRAAALAVRNGIPPEDLPVEALLEELTRCGLPPQEPASPQANEPAAALLAALRDEKQRGVAMWRLSRMTDSAAPDWNAFFAREADPGARIAGAIASAVARRLPDAGAELLHRVIREHRAEPRLGLKAPPLYLSAALALAEAGSPDASEHLRKMLHDADLRPYELVLVLKGLELAGDPAAVPAVIHFLEETRDEPFLITMWGVEDAWRMKVSWRFGVVLRAVRTLVALGDKSQIYRAEEFAQAENLLVRRYARRVLALADAPASSPS